jgi:hypothetical protein
MEILIDAQWKPSRMSSAHISITSHEPTAKPSSICTTSIPHAQPGAAWQPRKQSSGAENRMEAQDAATPAGHTLRSHKRVAVHLPASIPRKMRRRLLVTGSDADECHLGHVTQGTTCRVHA